MHGLTLYKDTRHESLNERQGNRRPEGVITWCAGP